MMALMGIFHLDRWGQEQVEFRMPDPLPPADSGGHMDYPSTDGSFELGLLVEHSTGMPFSGFTSEGTWFFAVYPSPTWDIALDGVPPLGTAIEVVE